jgi:peptidoglycan/LPS O-acetylase OafA/YrhL
MNLNFSGYRADIDGLRAIAVLSIVIYHFCPSLLTGGYVGVDIFFVISGFLISGKISDELINGSFSFASFYIRRIRRIFPSLILVLFVTLAVGWFTLLPGEFKELGKYTAGSAIFITNLILWSDAGYFDRIAELKPLLHLWSLGVEEQFYIFWPFLLWGAWKRISLILIIAALLAISLALNIAIIGTDRVIAFYSPVSRLWELASGALLAQIMRMTYSKVVCTQTIVSQVWKNIASIIGFAAILLPMNLLTSESIFPGWNAVFPVFGTVLIIWAGMSSCINRLFLANPLMSWIGMVSYPLYLWHWPLLAYIRILTHGAPLPEFLAIAFICCLALSIFTAHIYEPYFRFGKFGVVKAIALVVMMLLILIVGKLVVWSNGYTERAFLKRMNANLIADDLSKYNEHNCSNSVEWSYHYLNNDFFCMRSSYKESMPTTVIIGDSHAYPMYFGYYESIVNLGGERLLMLGAPGCPPIYDLESFEAGSSDKCRNIMNQLLERARSDPDIYHVVLVARGPLYFSGIGYGDVDRHNRILRKNKFSGPAANRELFLSGIENTIITMQSARKRVSIVLSPPELGFEPKQCFNEHPFSLPAKGGKKCGLSYQDYITRSYDYRQAIYSLNEKIKDLKIIDPEKAICDRDYCHAYVDGQLLYSDNNHLSASGAQRVMKYELGN